MRIIADLLTHNGHFHPIQNRSSMESMQQQPSLQKLHSQRGIETNSHHHADCASDLQQISSGIAESR
jgi:hypothetical protein